MTPKVENADFIRVTVSFIHIESSVIPVLKALIKIFILSSFTNELRAIHDDVMTLKLKKQFFVCNCGHMIMGTLWS